MDECRRVIVAPGAGFCGGVESAIKKALSVATNKKNGRIFLDGELVHNRDVNDRLHAQGIQLLKENSVVCAEDTIIIRAHGISPQRRSHWGHLGCEIVDCTCPLVRRISKIIETHGDQQIILLGDRGHAEVEGLCGHSKNIRLCESLTELSQFIDAVQQEVRIRENISSDKYTNPGKMDPWILVCQSTLDMDFLEGARRLCGEKQFSIEIFNTICSATKRRQRGLRALEGCDAVLVVGGFHSANTKRLYEKMKQKMAMVFWVENVSDLVKINLNIYKKIGIAAGTSTPQSVLRDIYNEIAQK
jgi:4-hydroxy-3-methylbut-2-enyl diphosphate reductase